ncbi:MAG: hypothetical protein H7318_09620 [Oligoflexus sp.]|nr:hypothetical protein [Oligoflexus sp.]
MRVKVYSSVVLSCLVLGMFGTLLRGQRDLQASVFRLRAEAFDRHGYDRWRELSQLARERARLYEQAIERDHLSKGMIVNRHIVNKQASSTCDSLLFSSLRFIALQKLGEGAEADKAWSNIVDHSYQDGRWIRHPDCKRKSASRDMIVGLMAALSQEPQGHEVQFARLLHIIDRTGGSVDDGPFYVSRLSPGMGELLKHMAASRSWKERDVPPVIRVGFSTVEFDTWIAAPGFGAHLNALTLWIELELLERHPELEIRSLSGLMDEFAPTLGTSFADQRRAWAADQLYNLDPDNMFFEYLRLRTAGALNYSSKARLLSRLLSMPQFPVERLPQDCDRKADYLWQRSSGEYTGTKKCSESFHGVDFLWMVSLLSEDNKRGILSSSN